MTILFLAILSIQDGETVPLAEKDAYLPAAQQCEIAFQRHRTFPRKTVQILTAIIQNPALKRIERRLRIEISPGRYSKTYTFYPYQYRARARMALADKTDDGATALNHLYRAEHDLEESVRRGLAGSASYLKLAREKIRRRGGRTGDDPLVRFDREWTRLVNEGRFSDAKKLLAERGGALPAEKRKEYRAKTEEACRSALARATSAFLKNLRAQRDPYVLPHLSEDVFRQGFALPARETLVLATPEYEWCARVRAILSDLRRKKDSLDALLREAQGAIPLASKGRNTWFEAVERLAFPLVRDAIEKRARDAREADSAVRKALRTEADELARKWNRFDEAVRRAAAGNPDFLAALPKRDFAALFEKFPVDLEGLNRAVEALVACPKADDPEGALAEVEKTLQGLRAKWDRLSVESKRSIVAYQIVARILREFLALRTLEEVAAGLSERGSEWRTLGGKTAPQRFGPKVADVFRRLLR